MINADIFMTWLFFLLVSFSDTESLLVNKLFGQNHYVPDVLPHCDDVRRAIDVTMDITLRGILDVVSKSSKATGR